MNLGQMALLLRGKYLVDIQSVTKVKGMAFLADEIESVIDTALDGTLSENLRERDNLVRLAAVTVNSDVTAGVNA